MRRIAPVPFLLLVILCALACRPKYSPDPVCVVFNDFESVSGWINTPSNNSNTVVKEDAYSGNYCYKIDKDHGFGYFYKRKFSDITDKKISWVKVSGYCKSKSAKLNKASMVACLQDDKGNYLKWSEAFLEEFVYGKKDKWIYFERAFDISAEMKPDAFFSAFVWSNDSGDEVLIDDFKVEFFD